MPSACSRLPVGPRGFSFCGPYLEGSSGWHPQLSLHPHSGLRQRVDTVHQSLPPPLNSQPGLWLHLETSLGRFCGCWCQKRRASRSQGPQPSSTCVLGCCFRKSTKRKEEGTMQLACWVGGDKNPSEPLTFPSVFPF